VRENINVSVNITSILSWIRIRITFTRNMENSGLWGKSVR